jgi:hypothetical protein
MGTAKQEAAGSEAGMSYEFMHRAHRASTEGRKMGGSVGVWGTPCSIQRGLARRLCILLVCTDPLSKRELCVAAFSSNMNSKPGFRTYLI